MPLASHHITSQKRQVNSTWHHYSSYKSTFSWATFLWILSLKKYVYDKKDNRRKTTWAEPNGDFNEEPYVRKWRQKRTKKKTKILKPHYKIRLQKKKIIITRHFQALPWMIFFFFPTVSGGEQRVQLTCSAKVQGAEKRGVSSQQILLEPCYIDSSIFAL